MLWRCLQVTMVDRGAAERACKDANPIIDGRKANVNLAYLGAKPRSSQSSKHVRSLICVYFLSSKTHQTGGSTELLFNQMLFEGLKRWAFSEWFWWFGEYLEQWFPQLVHGTTGGGRTTNKKCEVKLIWISVFFFKHFFKKQKTNLLMPVWNSN